MKGDWRSTSELPERLDSSNESAQVLIAWSGGSDRYVGYYDYARGAWKEAWEGVYFIEDVPDYWMPLPKHPEDELIDTSGDIYIQFTATPEPGATITLSEPVEDDD